LRGEAGIRRADGDEFATGKWKLASCQCPHLREAASPAVSPTSVERFRFGTWDNGGCGRSDICTGSPRGSLWRSNAPGSCGLALFQRLIGLVGYLQDAVGQEIGCQILERLFSISAAFICQKYLLAVDRNVFDDSLIAVICQRCWIDLRLAISKVLTTLSVYAII
jgi:hypothetical protein